MFIRICPKCQNEVFHRTKYSRNQIQKQNRPCRKCSTISFPLEFYNNLNRNCPKCNEIITYSHMGDKTSAEKNKSTCKKCMDNSGKFIKGQTFPNKISNYKNWTNKFGKEEADKRHEIFVQKQKFNNSGSKNSMYGKPTPIGSGNGWSGWYKEWYFRSLLELSYVIKIIERFNLKWESAESKSLTCKYQFYGKERTYRADFLIENKYLVDCKPKKLQKSEENLAKQKAMIDFCKNKGLKFKFSDIPKLTINEIVNLYNSKQIKFLDRYEHKFKHKYGALLQ